MKKNRSNKSISFIMLSLIALFVLVTTLNNDTITMNAILGATKDSVLETFVGLVKGVANINDKSLFSNILWMILCGVLLPFICALIASYITGNTVQQKGQKFINYLKTSKFWKIAILTYSSLAIMFVMKIGYYIAFLSHPLEDLKFLNLKVFYSSLLIYDLKIFLITIIITAIVAIVMYITIIYLISDLELIEVVKKTSIYEWLMLIGLGWLRCLIFMVFTFTVGVIFGISLESGFIQPSESIDAVIYTIASIKVVNDIGSFLFIVISLALISQFGYNRNHYRLQFDRSYLGTLKNNKIFKLKLTGMSIVMAILAYVTLLASLTVIGGSYSIATSAVSLLIFIAAFYALLMLYKTIFNRLTSNYMEHKLTIFAGLKKLLFKLTMLIPVLFLYLIAYIGLVVMLVVAKLFVVRLILGFLVLGIGAFSIMYNRVLDLVIVSSVKDGKLGFFSTFKYFGKWILTNFKSGTIITAKTLVIVTSIMTSCWIIGVFLLLTETYILLVIFSLFMMVVYGYLKINSYNYLIAKFFDKKLLEIE